MVYIQLIVLLAMILIGSRMKGIGLGVMGMVGMLIFVFIFRMRPGEPPLDVLMIILSIVTTAACMQAAGGLDYLVYLAEKIIRKHPSRIIFLGPSVVFVLALFAGTSHVVYSMLPIISEVAAKKRIRPERPLSISVIAAHIALTGSPMSAATAALAGLLGYPRAAVDIMMICIPACFIGMLAGAASVLTMGKDLDEDPVFLEKMKDPIFALGIDGGAATDRYIKKGARTSVVLFGIAVLSIVAAGAFPSLLPHMAAGKASFSVNADGTLKMVTIIEIVTLSATAAMLLLTPTDPSDVGKSSLFTSMALALVSVFGVVWMSATFMENNEVIIRNALENIVQVHPWSFSIAIFGMGILMFSQSATTKVMMPLGIALGLHGPALIAMFPAVNSDFVLPGYPTLLAAINFDRTGTTRIGKWVVNHSFIRPGLVTVATAIGVGFLLSRILL